MVTFVGVARLLCSPSYQHFEKALMALAFVIFILLATRTEGRALTVLEPAVIDYYFGLYPREKELANRR